MRINKIEKRLLDIDGCAEYLGLSKATLYVWVCRRKIPYLKVGKLVRFDVQKIDGWLRNKQIIELN